ncbi:LysM peptidoglycan-binding domain-containing protein [Schleiferia thermophila]|uniref:LysM domain-containing protein n=1 Tax=Schleiferia thermophila TaxID=884107 RepID=A0A369A8B5_9FLAO|nr:LysM domain-containing protein [Schleiferia thermophila]RCX05385.1 LysM domain-containing protein [Schleiferia thermophila]
MTSVQNHLPPLSGNKNLLHTMSISGFKNFFPFVLVFLCWNVARAQNEFKFHKVQPGETVYSICKTYGIGQEEFYRYNPETRHSLKAGDVVMVPAAPAENESPVDTLKFTIHIVKEGQTLYSISREYDVPIDLIESNNPEIQNQVLKVGMRLLIPKNPKRAPLPSDDGNKEANQQIPAGFHRVEPGESLYSVARLYKISVSELVTINHLNDSTLRAGQLIRIKPETPPQGFSRVKPQLNEDKKDTIRYTMHRVENGETLTSLSKKYNISASDLLRFNPELNQMNLKAGMLLLIPVYYPPSRPITDSSFDTVDSKEVLEISTLEAVNYFGMLGKRKLRVLLIIPANPENASNELRPSEIVSMDYYLGVRTALELLQNEGFQITLKVTEAPENYSLLGQITFDIPNVDLVIGPFIPQQIKELNHQINGQSQLPIVLPFGQPSFVAPGNILLQETEEQEARALAHALQSSYPESTVYLIYSEKDQKANQLNDALKKYLIGRKIKEIRLGNGLQGLSQITDSPEPKVVSFFIDDNFLSSQFIDRIRKSGNSSTVLLLNRRILDNPLIEPRYLNHVNFLVAMPRYIHFEHPLVQAAAESISNQHKLEPNDITLHAFQSTYDLIKTLTDNRHKPEFLDLRSTRKHGVFQNAQVVVLTNRNYKLVPIQIQK